MKYQLYLLIVAATLGISGCTRQTNASLIERQHQFSMAIGKMEDQIDLIQLPGRPFQQTIDLVMKDGLFYISNGAAGKVMEFSSYGDLLTLFFNKSLNPAPVLLEEEADSDTVVNRKAYEYPFNEVGNIAVADSGDLLVQDTVPEDRQIWDEDSGTLLRCVVLRFAPDGSLVDYIGQEGVSGTPFGYVDSVNIGVEGQITVVTRTMERWDIFAYDAAGTLQYTFTFTEDELPAPEEGGILSVDTLVVAPEPDRLYVKADYYRDSLAGGGGQETDFRFDKSAIYWIDMKSGEFAGSLDLPPILRATGATQTFNREEQEIIQYLVGAAVGGYLFLVSPRTEDTYNLAIVDLTGLLIRRGAIELNDSETLYRTFYVTREGILSSFIGGNVEADIVLWRTDRFLNGEK